MNFIPLLILRLKKLRIILFIASLRRAFFRYLVMGGVEHRVVLSKNLSTIVDIGANRGQFALAARAFSNARIISFEPLPEIAAIYQKIIGFDLDVTLHVAAIGEISEKRSLYLSARDDSSSLLKIGDAQTKYYPGTHEVGRVDVCVGPLDLYVSETEIVRPALLKLDVQGFESQALAGCDSLLHIFDFVYCECSFVELYVGQSLASEIIGFLNLRGFLLIGIYNPSYDAMDNCIQADLLFTRKA